jgi:hypothetical protein
MDGGDTAEEKRGRFRRIEKEIGGRKYECRFGYGLGWQVSGRGREEKDAGAAASRSVSRSILNDRKFSEEMDVVYFKKIPSLPVAFKAPPESMES